MPVALPRRLVVWLVAPALAVAALASWAVSSPVGSSPDDDFHLASIWCGVGERPGLCEPGILDGEREVPRDLSSSPCFAHDSSQSAQCQGDDFGAVPLRLDATDRGNFAGLYPPVYYFVTGLLASDSLEVSVIAIRIFNAVLFVGLVTALLALLPVRRRAPALLAIIGTIVPLGAFLIASTNPSSWAVLSASIVLPALVGYFETGGRRHLLLGSLAAMAGVMGAGARADSAAFVAIASVMATVIAFRGSRRFVVAAILPLGLILISVAFYFSASQSEATMTGLSETEPPSLRAMLALFLLNILDVPSLWVGVFGGWGLGWLDTAMPAAVWILSGTLFASLLLYGYRALNRRLALATVVLFTVALLFPTYLLIRTQAVVGTYVQPRYVLPLLTMLAFVALLPTKTRPSRRVLVLSIGSLSAANSIALHTNIRRYTTGLEGVRINLNSGVEWWWQVGPSPMAIWAGGTLAFTFTLIALAEPYWRSRRKRVLQAVGPVGMVSPN